MLDFYIEGLSSFFPSFLFCFFFFFFLFIYVGREIKLKKGKKENLFSDLIWRGELTGFRHFAK
jgi:hypothetical protein